MERCEELGVSDWRWLTLGKLQESLPPGQEHGRADFHWLVSRVAAE